MNVLIGRLIGHCISISILGGIYLLSVWAAVTILKSWGFL